MTTIEDLKVDTMQISRSVFATSMKVDAMDSLLRNIYSTTRNDSTVR